MSAMTALMSEWPVFQITGLSPTQRAAVVLRHIAGLSYAEVAAALGCPEGTAKSHVSRGLNRLRTLLTTRPPEEQNQWPTTSVLPASTPTIPTG